MGPSSASASKLVCRLCHTGALGDERHMLLECSALADVRDEFSPLVADCSGVLARLLWAGDQPMVRRYIIGCLDECRADEKQTLFHPFSLVGCQGRVHFLPFFLAGLTAGPSWPQLVRGRHCGSGTPPPRSTLSIPPSRYSPSRACFQSYLPFMMPYMVRELQKSHWSIQPVLAYEDKAS